MKKLLLTALTLTCVFTFSGCSFVQTFGNAYKEIFLSEHKEQTTNIDKSAKDPIELQKESTTYFKLIKVETVTEKTFLRAEWKEIATIENIDTEEQLTFDLRKTDIPIHFTYCPDGVLFHFIFDDENVVEWDVFDAETRDSIKYMSYDEFFPTYNKNPNFFVTVNAFAPDVIYLSKWEPKTTFNLMLQQNEEGKYIIPTIVNDTTEHIAATYIKDPDRDYLESDVEYYTNCYLSDITIHISPYGNTASFAWLPAEIEDVKEDHKYVSLSNYKEGDIISVYRNRYFHNDTNEQVVLYAEELDRYLYIEPNQVGDVIWTAEEVVVYQYGP